MTAWDTRDGLLEAVLSGKGQVPGYTYLKVSILYLTYRFVTGKVV